MKQKDVISGKEEMLEALSNNLMQKGIENQKLLEKVSQLKNHIL